MNLFLLLIGICGGVTGLIMYNVSTIKKSVSMTLQSGITQPMIGNGTEEKEKAKILDKTPLENPDLTESALNRIKSGASPLISGAKLAFAPAKIAMAPGLIGAELAGKVAAKAAKPVARKIAGVAKVGVGKAYTGITNSKTYKKVKNGINSVKDDVLDWASNSEVVNGAKRTINGARSVAKKGVNWAGDKIDTGRKILGDAVLTAGIYGLYAADAVKDTHGYKVGKSGVRAIKGALTGVPLAYKGTPNLTKLMAAAATGDYVIRASAQKPINIKVEGDKYIGVGVNKNSMNYQNIALKEFVAMTKKVKEDNRNGGLNTEQIKKLTQIHTIQERRGKEYEDYAAFNREAVKMFPNSSPKEINSIIEETKKMIDRADTADSIRAMQNAKSQVNIPEREKAVLETVLSTTESASRNLREMAQSSISEQQKEEFKQKAIESLKEEKEVLTEKEVTTKVEDMVNKKVDETMELYKKRVLVSNDDREIEGLLGEEGKNALSEARKEISREVNTQYAKNIANNEARKDRAYLNANPEASELSQGELRTERQASDIRKKLTVVAKGNLKENNNEEKVIPISSRTNRAVVTGMAG